ncbi:MAG TPA: hypothetical protein VE131_07280, partial [Terriglobales bacterium]|nr:hypothetical protein [Terriglobales bacterium]
MVLSLMLVITGCASNRIVTQWSNPDYAERPIHRIMVIGISEQTSVRRGFEDQFVQQLRAAGYGAVASYRYIPENGKVSEARLKRALERSDADGALITRLVRVEEKTRFSPGYYYHEPFAFHGFYGWYSHAWNGFYEPPREYHYNVYVSETTLYDLSKDEVVWAATLRTKETENFKEAVEDYAQTVIEALKSKNVLAAR